ncbi:MAG TPA: RDD family protein [Streptosporangiaceae bacterium]
MSELVTGEAVVLELPVAAFPVRMVALVLDMLVQVVALTLLAVAAAASGLDSAALAAISVTGTVLIIVGYPTVFETLSRGRSLGKMALGLRVVSDDGGPERFRQALVRALAGIFEIWSLLLDPVALITSMVSAKGKRLGDVFAGTYVIQERVPRRTVLPAQFAVVPPPLAGWASVAELSGLSDRDAEAAGTYLRRYPDLHPRARAELGLRLAATVAAQVSPPPPAGTPPEAYLTAVLAVRREREFARLSAQRAQAGYQWPTVGQPAAPAAGQVPRGATQPGAVQPGAVQPGAVQPGAGDPQTEPGGDQQAGQQRWPGGLTPPS